MSKWNVNGEKIDNTRKSAVKSSEEVGFKIKIKSNLKTLDIRDVTFNLTNNVYKS